jgi:hypothetical protein
VKATIERSIRPGALDPIPAAAAPIDEGAPAIAPETTVVDAPEESNG